MCGEQPYNPDYPFGGVGSPPRVRGTARHGLRARCLKRITPACAGNRFPPPQRARTTRDHPRVCGEQMKYMPSRTTTIGSPPRVRGTDSTDAGLDLYSRITPACAGNSLRATRYWQKFWDHPRVCGEQSVLSRYVFFPAGSPPRVRGTVPQYYDVTNLQRITPACAGNRLKKARHFYILFCQIKRIHLV